MFTTSPKGQAQIFLSTIAATVAGLLLFSACSSDPEPTPVSSETPTTASPTSNSPSPEPTLSLEDQNIKEAKDVYTSFVEAGFQVGVNHYADWDTKVAPFWGSSEFTESQQRYYTTMATSGGSLGGSYDMVSLEATSYTPDPTGAGHERLGLRACIDNSAMEFFDAKGNPSPSGSSPKRFYTEAQLQHQGSGLSWTVLAETPHPDQPC